MRCSILWVLLTSSLAAQPGAIPGMDAQLIRVTDVTARGRIGAFPTGLNGLSGAITICNPGTVTIPWLAPMQEDHPTYAFLFCRAADGRFEQISDRSYVKHSFSSQNASGCGVCTTPGRTSLGPNCSDTYSANTNGDRFFLGPAGEVDPWLNAWGAVGSHFDRGEPDVGPPENADGARSLTRLQTGALDPVTHRIEVGDADLDVTGGRFFFAAQALVAREPEAVREDNMMSVEVAAIWSGLEWRFAELGTATHGCVLQHWTDASLDSATNGSDDGRFYVAVKVSGPDARGLRRYEYAIHNRDNTRGAAALRLPLCARARLEDVSFRDIDGVASNDWAAVHTGGELVFVAGAGNALEWNTIYNFGFTTDATPTAGAVSLDQARPGPGAASVTVPARVPSTLANPYLGDGCPRGAFPTLTATGSPARATMPNPTFGLRVAGMQPGATGAVILGATSGTAGVGGSCVWRLAPPYHAVPILADASGVAAAPVPVPLRPKLEGASVFAQAAELTPGGPALTEANLSNGLEIRIGNALPGCN